MFTVKLSIFLMICVFCTFFFIFFLVKVNLRIYKVVGSLKSGTIGAQTFRCQHCGGIPNIEHALYIDALGCNCLSCSSAPAAGHHGHRFLLRHPGFNAGCWEMAKAQVEGNDARRILGIC